MNIYTIECITLLWSSHLNNNNSAVSSNVSTGTASVQPVGVTGGGDRQDGNLFTGQETSGTMLSQILSTPGSVLVSAFLITAHRCTSVVFSMSMNCITSTYLGKTVCVHWWSNCNNYSFNT